MVTLKEEITDILLCFLRDNSDGKIDASKRISDKRIVSYNEDALNDALGCLQRLIKISNRFED